VESLVAEVTQGVGVKAAADRYHRLPDQGKLHSASSKIAKLTEEIEECFKSAASIEEIYERLTNRNTPWAHETIRVLNQQCPLSLVVRPRQLSLQLFKQARHLSYAGCLENEFNLVMQTSAHRNYNFVLGVTHRLVNKEKTTPRWEPSHFSHVDEAAVSVFFRNEEGPRLDLSRQVIGET
jgi:hypothetical protein